MSRWGARLARDGVSAWRISLREIVTKETVWFAPSRGARRMKHNHSDALANALRRKRAGGCLISWSRAQETARGDVRAHSQHAAFLEGKGRARTPFPLRHPWNLLKRISIRSSRRGTRAAIGAPFWGSYFRTLAHASALHLRRSSERVQACSRACARVECGLNAARRVNMWRAGARDSRGPTQAADCGEEGNTHNARR